MEKKRTGVCEALPESAESMKYKHLTAGGTFDRFHKGHRMLLEKTFAKGETVWLGITTNTYLSTLTPRSAKVLNRIQTYADRRKNVEEFLQIKRLLGRAKIVPIDDKFGTTLSDEQLEAIVVSSETELVATEINLLRAQKNWPALEVIVVPWVTSEDGKPINSARIRAGEIDREGRLYRWPGDWGVRQLPDDLRQIFKQPLGKLIGNLSFLSHLSDLRGRQLITVGDVVTKNLLAKGVVPDISIVDLKVARKQVYKNVQELGFREIKVLKKAKNAAGTLHYEAYKALLSLIKSEAKPVVLQIDGEEDLMTLFAIFLAPLGSLIVYGQPNEGMVVVEVNEEKKVESRKYLNQFIPISDKT